jgi:hypothetical protein
MPPYLSSAGAVVVGLTVVVGGLEVVGFTVVVAGAELVGAVDVAGVFSPQAMSSRLSNRTKLNIKNKDFFIFLLC